MRRILASFLLIITSLGFAGWGQDQSAREVFKVTRKPASDREDSSKQNKPIATTKAPPPTSSKPVAHKGKGNKSSSNSHNKKNIAKGKAPDTAEEKIERPFAVSPDVYTNVGLGYTLFLDNGSGELSTVSPARVFHTGQSVRLLLESNIDGYLYIFHQENDGPPKMLFPSWQDNEGNNHVRAHQLVVIPAENKLTFVGDPAVEILTMVVSREPIAGLPIGDRLRDLGRVYVPARLFHELSQPCSCRKDLDDTEGRKNKHFSGARDIEMTKADPLPAYIYVNRHQNTKQITARIKLVHE